MPDAVPRPDGLARRTLRRLIAGGRAPKYGPKAPVTPALYTWNCKAEANRTFEPVARDDAAVLDHAARLDTFSRQPGIRWQSHGVELDAIKARVNDMGSKLCRLETIRRVLDPWQQREVDRIANRVQLLADNTQDAIQYLNTYQSRLLMPACEMYPRRRPCASL